MPKALPAPELRDRAESFWKHESRGNLALAARTLGVDYDFLWRFVATGRGSSGHRLRLEAGLAAQNTVARAPIGTSLREIARTSESLSLTRAVLMDLLGALDALEAEATSAEGLP
jgi:hypothetical protein